MAYEEFTGELDKPLVTEFTGELDKPEPGILDRVGSAMNAVRDFATGAGKPSGSVLQGRQIEAPAGMTDDVNVDDNRFARDRSKSPKSVMFTKANAADRTDKLTKRGEKVLKETPVSVYDSQEELDQSALDSESNKQFAKTNPVLSAIGSGSASAIAGQVNSVPMLAQAAKEGLTSVVNFFNNATVNPYIEAAGGAPLRMDENALGERIGNSAFADRMQAQADDLMPEVGKKSIVDTYGTPEFLPSLVAKLASQAPQMATQVAALFFPALQTPFIVSMGLQQGGSSYQQGDSGGVAAAKGLIEAGSEYLPFEAAHKLGQMAAKLPSALQNKFLAEVGRRAFEAGGKITAAHLVEGAEEVASQFGQNVLDKYVTGKQDVNLKDGLVDSGVVGAIAGGMMGAKNAYNSLAGNTRVFTPEEVLARELQNGVNGVTINQDASNQQALNALNPSQGIDPRLTSIPVTREGSMHQIGTASSTDEATAAFAEATHTSTPSVTDLISQAGLSNAAPAAPLTAGQAEWQDILNGTNNGIPSVPPGGVQPGGADANTGVATGASAAVQPGVDAGGVQSGAVDSGDQSAAGVQAAPIKGASAFSYTINPSGTVEVHGDPEKIIVALQGHRGMRSANGVTYGVSRAQEVMSKIDQAHGVSFPTDQAAVAHAQQLGVADQTEVINTGESSVLAPVAQKETVGDLRKQSLAVSNLQSAVAANGEDFQLELARIPDASDEQAAAKTSADRAIELVGRVTQVAFGFKPISITGLNSAYGVQHAGNLFVNRDAVAEGDGKGNSVVALAISTIGHEGAHNGLEKSQDPEDKKAYANFTKVVDQYLRSGAVAERQGQEQSTEDYAKKEVVADINGAMWLDTKFWSRLYDIDSGSTMRRVAYRFMQAATKFVKVAKGSRLDAGKFVTNVEAVREAAAQVWANKASRSGKPISRTQAKSELNSPSFSRRSIAVADHEADSLNELGAFNLDSNEYDPSDLTFPDLDMQGVSDQPNDPDANRPLDPIDMATAQAELDEEQRRMAIRTAITPATVAAPQTANAPKDPTTLTRDDIKKEGLFAERAIVFGKEIESGDFIRLDMPAGLSGSYNIAKEGDAGAFSLDAPGTWVGNDVSMPDKQGAIDFVKRMLSRRIVIARGYDLLDSYRKKKIGEIASVWKALAQQETAFKFKKYEGASKDFQEIAQSMGAFKEYTVTADPAGSYRAFYFTNNQTGRRFAASLSMLSSDSFSVCTMGLKGSDVGTTFYAVMGEWARANKLSFHADGLLSGINTYRRTEQATSFALKHWDASVLLTGSQNRVYGFKNGAVTAEENDQNIVRLLLAGMRNAVELIPQIRNYSYDFKNDTFLDNKGNNADAKIDELLKGRNARAFGVGRTTLARALITSEIIKGNLTIADVGAFDKSVAYSLKESELNKPQAESWGDEDGGVKPEVKAFMQGSTIIDKDGVPVPWYHGTSQDIKGFRPKQAGAIFITPAPKFADDFAHLSHDWMTNHYREVLSPEQIQDARDEATAYVMKDKSLPMSERRFIAEKLKERNVMGAAKDLLDQFISDKLPSGPNIIPVFVKAESPFDYRNKKHRDNIIDMIDANARNETGATLIEGGAYDGKDGYRFSSPDRETVFSTAVIDALLERGDWSFIEEPEVQQAIKDMGHDGFYVKENGQVNLGVYSNKQLKSVFNTGAFGTRSVTEQEAAGRGLSVQEANEAQAAGDLSFSKKQTPEEAKAALAKKFERMQRFYDDMPTLLERIHADAKSGVEEAAILQLIAKTGFRIGGKVDLVEGKEAFGASTLKPEHLSINGPVVSFDFVGKAGVRQRHAIEDAELAEMLRKRLDKQKLFDKADRAVRKYLDQIQDGKDYKVHDFRTWNATAAALSVVNDLPLPVNEAEYRAGVELAGSVAASKIGDQLGVTLEHYVDPKIFEEWRKSAGITDATGVQAGAGEGQAQGSKAQLDGEGSRTDGEAPEAELSYSKKLIVGDTGRQYTPTQLQAMDDAGFRTEVPTLKEKLAELRRDFGKKMAQGLADQFAPVREFDEHAYTLLRMSKGAAGALEALLHGGQIKITDDIYDFNSEKSGGVLDRLLKPLQGEHHDFLRWVAANRAERLAGEGRENLLSAATIASLKTLADGGTRFDYTLQHGANAGQVTRDRNAIYNDALKTFSEFNKNVLDMAEQSGLIDPEARAVWEHDFYVPFYRVAEEGGGVAHVKSGVVRQQAFKELKGGSDKLRDDLLDNTLMNWSHLLDASAKNRAAKATLEAAQDMGIAIEAKEHVARQMGKSTKNSGGIVWFMDEGQQRFFLVDDPYVLTALTGLAFAGFNSPIMKAMNTFKHVLTVGVTASPFFKVRNLIRDSVQAISVSELSLNPVANVARGWGLTRHDSDAHFRNLASGATIHFATMYEGSESRRVQQLVNSGVAASSILNSPSAFEAFRRKVITPLISSYNELGNRGEEINRASLYDQLVKRGVSHAEAALQARDLMDFSMQGSFTSVRFLSQVVPFLNARIQGMYKLGKGAAENPAKFSVTLAGVALASLSLLAMYRDDDDWKKREDWDRNNFWWFKIGSQAYRIPKPFEIGAIATLAERGAEWMFDKEMTNRRLMDQVYTLLADNLSMNPIPQMAKPLLDLYANKDSFTGRAIESPSMTGVDARERYTADTPMPVRYASNAANAVGIKASPVQIEHVVRGYFGWLGAFIMGGGDILARSVTNQPEKPSQDLWKFWTGGMVADKDSGQSRYVSQMYEQAKVLEEAMKTYKLMANDPERQEEAKVWYENHAKEIQAYGNVEGVKRAEGNIAKEIHRIEKDRRLTSVQKRVEIDRLKLQKHEIAKTLQPY